MDRSIRQGHSRSLNSIAESPWFAYMSIALLQAKVMLGIWKYRDLTAGDTSYYYAEVFKWLDQGKGNFIWSPIYTAFLAGLHGLLDNPFWVLTVARIGIALCATILVLALMRRLLPNHIAWIVAAWWALLPINFDTAYSIHLFSALFPLTLFVVAAYANNIYGRGIVLGGLLLTGVLVRNEYIALFLLCLLVIAGYEFYFCRKKGRSPSPRTYVFAYGLPLAIAVLIIGIFYFNAEPSGFSANKNEFEIKHTGNVCQIYAFTKRQQGDSWRGNPWTECSDLLERDFGRSEVTFSQALFLNPPAILKHIWWNIKLIPSGTQLALFDYYAGGPNPDYMAAKQSPLVWVPFLLVFGLGALAVVACFILPWVRKRQPIENGFVWFLLSSSALLVLGIVMMQRPRPSYMFPYSLFIMALTGLGLHRLFELAHLNKAGKTWWPVLAILMVFLVPSFYDVNYSNSYGYKGQPLRESYERVSPYLNRRSASEPVVLVTPSGDESLCNYLGISSCTMIQYGKIAGPNLDYFVNYLGINWIYLDAAMGEISLPYEQNSWQLVSQGNRTTEKWLLLHRREP